MKNVTVSLPEDTARWLRVEAAKADRSVSSWLANLLDTMRCHVADDRPDVVDRLRMHLV